MGPFGWIQLGVFLALLALLTRPMGAYLVRVLDPTSRTPFDRVFRPLERLLYRLFGVDPGTEQTWSRYALSLLLFSAAGLLFTFAVLRFQHLLPLNPRKFGPVRADLAFNTAVSFLTNTNWQSYAGEATLSHFSQMVGLVFHNFVSAAAGIAVAAAVVRALARASARTIGNFWVDLVRINLYLLLPFSFVFAVVLGSQGVIQNFDPPARAAALGPAVPGAGPGEGAQLIPQGPVASQVAIKILGTNGGGFFNANAAHPYENPTPLSNFLQMLAILLIPSGLTSYFGRLAKNRRHGWAVWRAMALLLLAAILIGWRAEAAGNPRWTALGVDPAAGNMEGKEVRFGTAGSSLFAAVTTDAACGAVNAMHDSFTPLGGLVPLFNIQLGEVVFGGVGAGLFGMIVFIVLAVFLTGLMIGRTPEYLGKKIESYDVKAAVLALLALVLGILGFSALASAGPAFAAGPKNAGPHGFSEILYAYSSAAGNNGSAFAGLNADTPAYNLTLAAAMLVGRFLLIVPVLALAGNMVRKKKAPPSPADFPVDGLLFTSILVFTILIVGALTFLPALALGPILEHFLMAGSGVLF